MPRIIYTPRAIACLVRLAKFLNFKDNTVAKQAISVIRIPIEKAAIFPDRYRPFPDLIHYRELIIDYR